MKLMAVFFIEKKIMGNVLKTQVEITSGYHQRDTSPDSRGGSSARS
jgi:hypothetical protein